MTTLMLPAMRLTPMLIERNAKRMRLADLIVTMMVTIMETTQTVAMLTERNVKPT